METQRVPASATDRVSVHPLQEGDLDEADRVVRVEGVRVDFVGVAMERPDEPGYNRGMPMSWTTGADPEWGDVWHRHRVTGRTGC
jgi:hypothetical protein